MLLNPKTPLAFGVIAIAALAGYLFVYHPLPNALSRAHAQIIPGTDIHSCDQCHSDEGLTAGCLVCHKEIAGQLDVGQGYHAFLAEDKALRCGSCHREHHGDAFPLVCVLSWPGGDPNTFDHPHCDYQLMGRHDQLACSDCHDAKPTETFTLPDFPRHPRPSTFLGLTQDCLACHVDVHVWPSEKACLDCHDQIAFDPASAFRHDDVFALQGTHAETHCVGCHPSPESGEAETSATARTPGSLPFHKITGKTCEECHPTPHRTTWQAGCEHCHLGRDAQWDEGTRGMDVTAHEPTGLALTGGHVTVTCEECHPQDQEYAQRYPDPKAAGYRRQPDMCQGCHEDVHLGKLDTGCTTCHQTSGWKDGDLLFDHDRDTAFALDAAHRGLSCRECHAADDLTYRAEGTECAACHEVQAEALRGRSRRLQIEPDPHFGRVACIDCHDVNVPRQPMASHARRCADCHNDQYAQLAYQWAQALQQRQAAVERLAQQLDTVSAREMRADLDEAVDCGFHHVHLTRQLYDRLLETLPAQESTGPELQKETP